MPSPTLTWTQSARPGRAISWGSSFMCRSQRPASHTQALLSSTRNQALLSSTHNQALLSSNHNQALLSGIRNQALPSGTRNQALLPEKLSRAPSARSFLQTPSDQLELHKS